MQLMVNRSGDIRCVYSEELDLKSLGKLSIRRGSHVEADESGQWLADLSPVRGPRLGPFANRSEALAAELAWLEQHRLTVN